MEGGGNETGDAPMPVCSVRLHGAPLPALDITIGKPNKCEHLEVRHTAIDVLFGAYSNPWCNANPTVAYLVSLLYA